MDNKKVENSFCPQCGALTEDGVCTGCGAKNIVDTPVPVAEAVAEPVAENVAEPAVSMVETVQSAESQVNAVKFTVPVTPVNQGQYVNNNPYSSNPYGNNPYSSNPYGNNPYGNNPYNSNPYSSNPYNNPSSNPYGVGQNNNTYANGAIPSDTITKKKNGKAWVIIGVCIGIAVLLMVLLGLAVGQLVSKVNEASSAYSDDDWDDYDYDDYDYDYDYDDYDDYEDDYSYDDEYGYDDYYDYYEEDEPIVSPDGKTYGYDPEDDYYYQLNDNIREDLSYSVTFYEGEYTDGEGVNVCCIYPVLSGDIRNKDYLNAIIYEEYNYFVDYYVENIQGNPDEDNYYYVYTAGYVPYMDEDVISIVFREEAATSDSSLVALYCINIDVKKGIVIDNTEIIDANDEFSIDFRTREAAQNQSDTLDYYTDQELTEMFNDSYNLIIFYTPLGLEVGLNHDFGWSTATYKDYENYLKQF